MSERTYPYKAWALQPSFKPVEVELVNRWGEYGQYRLYDQSAKGKPYHVLHDLHQTKAAAIAAGRKKIDEQQADIDKRIERINKRAAALDKAEREA